MEAIVCTQASLVPSFVFHLLRTFAVKANTILPTLEKCAALDQRGQSPANHWWIVAYRPGPQPTVDCVLSLTETYMGTRYPAFIFTTWGDSQLHANPDAVIPAIQALVNALVVHVPVSMVYSVFAHVVLAQRFTRLWTDATGVGVLPDPYYDSWLTFLRHDAQLTPDMLGPQYEMRLVTQDDVPDIARLCHMFAADSPPFTLSLEAAQREASILARCRMVWVMRVNGVLASVVAFTRNSAQVATITKVFTVPAMRGHRCAERLVRRVCYELVHRRGHQTVALYVGCSNLAANVYRRVGFQDYPAAGVERWVEYGFSPDRVTIGHW